MPRLRLLLGLFLLILLSRRDVAAKTAEVDPLAGSCDNYPLCAALAAEAREHSQAGRYEEAKRAYLQAYQRRADSRLLYNLARVMHKAHRAYEAVTYYKAYLDAGAEGNKDQQKKAEQYMEQARAEDAASPQPHFDISPNAVHDAEPAPAPLQPQPLYRKWWLWTIVGVAVAGIAVGAGLGVASQRPDYAGAVPVRPF